MRDPKIEPLPEGSGCVGGCAGAVLGAFLGVVLTIGVMYACAVGPAHIEPALAFGGLMMVIGAGVGVAVGARIGGKAEGLASSVPPEVEEAARAHFTPSTRQRQEPQPETGIQPEVNDRGEATDRQCDPEQ